ncbi:hypothetical protein V8E54_002870 [Elaphomyces granulatus]
MPEPISALILGTVKLFSMHTAHAAAAHTTLSATGGVAVGATSAHVAPHIAAYFFVGVVAGTVLHSICKCLKRLVEGGIFTQKQADAFKSKARSVDEKTQKAMLYDAETLCDKWNV